MNTLSNVSPDAQRYERNRLINGYFLDRSVTSITAEPNAFRPVNLRRSDLCRQTVALPTVANDLCLVRTPSTRPVSSGRCRNEYTIELQRQLPQETSFPRSMSTGKRGATFRPGTPP